MVSFWARFSFKSKFWVSKDDSFSRAKISALRFFESISKFKTNFVNGIGSVFYQVACHQRVQNIGQVTKKILELIPETDVEALERCSGHDGTYGVKEETHNIAIKIATPIVREYKKNNATQFTSDCTLAAHHIVNAMGNKVMPTHPISLIKKAYGI